MSVAIPGRSFLSAADERAIKQASLDGLETALSLDPIALVLYRTDPGTGQPMPLSAVTVARRWANRQPRAVGTEAATATRVDGDFRAYAPWDVQKGDAFALPEGPGEIVGSIVAKFGVVTAQFALDQGAP